MDVRTYIGIPFVDHACGFDGCDCYGLVRLVYRNELGLELPGIEDDYGCALCRNDVGHAVEKYRENDWCRDVTDLPPKPFDVLVFTRGGVDFHVGLWMEKGTMLHIIDGRNCCLEKFDSHAWSRMLTRRLRHERLC